MQENSLWSPVCDALNPEGLIMNYCKRKPGSQSNPNWDTVATRQLLPFSGIDKK